MAHSYCNPVWCTLFNSKGNCFNFRSFLKIGLHYSKFISCRVLTLNNLITHHFDIWMLQSARKFKSSLFPKILCINIALDWSLIFCKLFIDLINIFFNHFINLLIGTVNCLNKIGFSNRIISLTILVRKHCNNLFYWISEIGNIFRMRYSLKCLLNLSFWIRIFQFYLFNKETKVTNKTIFDWL